MLKNQKISFRCTDKEKEKIQKKAGQHGIPVGEYVLEAALSGGKRIKGVSKDVVIELVEVTTMINELQMEISRYAKGWKGCPRNCQKEGTVYGCC